jgi:hypothetical protein
MQEPSFNSVLENRKNRALGANQHKCFAIRV